MEPRIITEQEFLASKGCDAPFSDYLMDKMRCNRQIRTQRGQKRFEKEAEQARLEYAAKREKARAEYRFLVDCGEIRDKTRIEQLLERANGHPDLDSTKAARRLLSKRGIDWQRGVK